MPGFEVESPLKTEPLDHPPLPSVESATIKIEAGGEEAYVEEPTDKDSSESDLRSDPDF
ncbi:hypothetical protein Q9L58_008709 [Maublancomyces gigas]|uniref:Uncharacterized protein n=1 Tax=Discina gigas TaxID=1032678 RepID=A0ABR3G9C4_9PEZI